MTSQKIKAGGFVIDCFNMFFDHPVCLESGKAYKIISDTNGPLKTSNLTNEMTSVKCAGVTFTFSGTKMSCACSDNESRMQFPPLIFSL